MDNSCTNSGPAESVLDLIARGGDAFVGRIRAYQEAKENHDKSFAALQLGRDTKAQEVAAAKAAAEKIVEDARKRADSIVADATADAQASAREIVAEANERKAKVDAEAERIKKDAEQWARQTTVGLETKVAHLKAALRGIETL
jgi:vacuolar-type H+-ATPase subunit H